MKDIYILDVYEFYFQWVKEYGVELLQCASNVGLLIAEMRCDQGFVGFFLSVEHKNTGKMLHLGLDSIPVLMLNNFVWLNGCSPSIAFYLILCVNVCSIPFGYSVWCSLTVTYVIFFR